MLPDFYSIKRELLKKVDIRARTQIARELGFVGAIKKVKCFEGNRNRVIGSDGKVFQDNEFHQASTGFQIPTHLIDQMGPTEILKKLDEMAKEMAHEQKRYFFEAMNKIIDAAGNSLDAKGARFSIKLFLEGLDKIDLDFNADGTAKFPTLILHPDMHDLALEELKKLDDDSQIKKEFEEIIQKKRSEWLARENNRQLVG